MDKNMDNSTVEPEDLEVTVEVVPQTVNEIVYMTEDVPANTDSSCYVNSEEDEEETEADSVDTCTAQLYDIGSVDAERLTHMSLVLDESQSFVFLQQEDYDNDQNMDYVIEPKEISEEYLENGWNTCLFACSECEFKSHSPATLTTHSLLHKNKHTKDEYVCKVCGEQFERAQTLSHHFKTSHQRPKLICNICGCPCVNESALLAHYKKHEPKAFSCDVCNAEYDNAVSLNNHIKTHATTLLYACNKCDASFSSTSEVSIHLRYVHAKPRDRIKTEPLRTLTVINPDGYVCTTNAVTDVNVQCQSDSETTQVKKQNRKRKR